MLLVPEVALLVMSLSLLTCKFCSALWERGRQHHYLFSLDLQKTTTHTVCVWLLSDGSKNPVWPFKEGL